MYAISVEVTVKEGRTDEFLAAVTAQAEASRAHEPGCLRFEILRSRDDKNRFVLNEVYATEEDFTSAHKETPHYARWAEVAQEVLVGDRVAVAYEPVRVEIHPDR